MSSILFVLSNIFVPIVILIYKTTIRVRQQGQNGCGQWLCLIMYTFISNFLYYIAYNSKIYLFGDLAIKLAICFMPPTINQNIQKKISYLHLQILFQQIRSYLIQFFYKFHSFLTSTALSKMDDIERKHFIEAINKQLEKQSQNKTEQSIVSNKLNIVHKHYDNMGVNCHILTPQMLQKQKRQRDTLNRVLSGQKRAPKPTGHLSPPKDQNSQKSIIQVSDGESGMRKKNSILIQRSTTDLGIIQQDQVVNHKSSSMIRKKVPQIKKKAEVVASQKKQKPRQKKSELNNVKEPSLSFDEQPSEILNKLDVSDYSDMFEEDQQFDDGNKTLITKIQAIVEIGAGASVRLQIYNIQLYSNDQIRIMSLYGRQFEKHRLIAIQPQKHGYYELKLQGGKVNKRRVKFRGKMDPFSKYLLSPTK